MAGFLKHGFRLNRTLGGTLLVIGVISGLEGTGLTIPLIATVIYLVINEWGIRTLKRHPSQEESLESRLFLLLLVLSTLLIALYVMMSGHLSLLFLLLNPFLQAQLNGEGKRARGILILGSLLYLIHTSTLSPATFWLSFWTMLPLALTLWHTNHIASLWINSNSHKVHRLQSLAATDGLTGLINRRQFNHQLDAEIARARRYRSPLSLALLDIDDFKKINDTFGHPIGDQILQELTALLRDNIRESDIAARYGGEEFALILPETAQMSAFDLLERLRARIEHTVFCLPEKPMTCTISVGVAQLDLQYPKSIDLIERADLALYEAKHQGKNRVITGTLAIPKVVAPTYTQPPIRVSHAALE